VAIIKDTHDVKLLNQWRADDRRAEVQDAISDQIKAITLGEDDRKKAKGE
jgi:CO dehydrogenase/acetyl-CoA synthase gamma subunit (corrinoid Fe-S protein)